MTSDSNTAAKSSRRPLYIIGTVLLTVLLVAFWFSDSLGSMFEKTPTEDTLAGAWVFDQTRAKELLVQAYGSEQQLPSMEKTYGKAVFTFAPGTITMDNGSGTATPTPCKVQGYPPNAFLITIGEGKGQRELVFQVDETNGTKQLYLSNEGSIVPFKSKD